MTAESFDAAAYLRRLNLTAPPPVTLGGLSGLLAAHMRAIPFENLDVLLGQVPRMDLPGLQDKLVRRRRGGYCFEHAGLMRAALATFGFTWRDGLARVVMERPRECMARTHHFLIVTLPDGEFVIDPGLGGLAPRVPVPLRDGVDACIGAERHALHRDGGLWSLRARLGEDVLPLWVTALEEALPPDFEMGNHYTATHPASNFRQRLMLRALTDDGRVSVLNREVTWRRGLHVERRTLADRAELRALLLDHFGIDLPEVDGLRVPQVPDWA